MNFQSESKRSGDEFEDKVLKDLKLRGFSLIQKNIYIPRTGCEVDFLTYKGDNPWSSGLPVEYVESKGGRDDDKKRPGAQRTDNVKKAIANGALIKAVNPEAYYVVYFSAKPFAGSYSAEMIDTALCHKIIDEVRYIIDRTQNTDELVLFKMDESEAQK